MDLKLNYNQILRLIHQLPEKDIEKLVTTLQSELSSKKRSKKSNIQEIILNAPTWTDHQYDEYLKAREHINKSRLL